MPDDVAKQSYYKLERAAPIARPEDMADYDAIIFGTPTRFGMMSAQMKTFLDQAGALWQNGSLVGKIGSVITSSGTQHGGQESTILSFHVSLLHFGMILVGLPYSFAGQSGVDEVKGGTPYGASTISDADGSRMPSEIELDGARFQGAHVAKLSKKLNN